ncbi:hypothetical protein G6F66_014790 [Rhizopus arrhizus]|nr:hypothetical protein G6F66_014790 [Rhizopus arrhizus]
MPAFGGVDVAGFLADFGLRKRGIAHGAYTPSALCSMTPPFMIRARCSPCPNRQDKSRYGLPSTSSTSANAPAWMRPSCPTWFSTSAAVVVAH